MANHKSALKRVRSSEKKRIRNQYQHKSLRTFVKQLIMLKDPKEAQERLPDVISRVDKLVKRRVIPKNRGSRIKARVAKRVNQIAR